MANANENTSAASALTAPAGYAWDTANDEFEEILDGRWAVIRTADGWEIESQSCASCFALESTDMESAKIEGKKMALEIEGRFSHTIEDSHGVRNERS